MNKNSESNKLFKYIGGDSVVYKDIYVENQNDSDYYGHISTLDHTLVLDSEFISPSGNVSLNNLTVSGTLNVSNINCSGTLSISAGNGLSVNGTVSADSFLSLHEFKGFPQDTMEIIPVIGVTSNFMKWIGCVLASNGKIYGIPYGTNIVLIFDPVTENIDITSIIVPASLYGTWAGGILAPNGKIYCIPEAGGNVLIIDPATNSLSHIPGVNNNSYYGGVLYPNGKIYCVPYGATNVLIIDTINDTINQTDIQGLNNGVNAYGSSHKWIGGALAPNGKIYMVPMLESRILIVDPLSPVSNLSGTFSSATYADSTKTLVCPGATFTTSVSVGDNIIITTTTTTYTGYVSSITNNTTLIFVYYLGGTLSTPVNLSAGSITNLQKTRKADITTITNLPGDWRNTGCVLAPNGNIYTVPHDNSWVTIIDTVNNTTSQLYVPISFYGNNYRGGVLAPNGKIYCMPSNRQDVLVIDTSNNTTSFINNIVLPVGNYKYIGGVFAPNGNIYSIPWNTGNILKIKTGLPKLPPWMLEGYFNKF
jgi:hypothetical protein